MFSRRWQYDELEAPTPLRSGARIRLPGIDMRMITGRQKKVVNEIESQALGLAAELATQPLPQRADEYGDRLCRGFHLDEHAPARDWVHRWLTVGWSVGTVEEMNDAALPGKAERHHLAAVNILRGQMYAEVEQSDDETIRESADAYLLSLFGGYYLRREPTATVDTIVQSWGSSWA